MGSLWPQVRPELHVHDVQHVDVDIEISADDLRGQSQVPVVDLIREEETRLDVLQSESDPEVHAGFVPHGVIRAIQQVLGGRGRRVVGADVGGHREVEVRVEEEFVHAVESRHPSLRGTAALAHVALQGHIIATFVRLGPSRQGCEHQGCQQTEKQGHAFHSALLKMI